ncbi:MAG TPA: DUF2244 domain-containing protein [Candidatus Cybelea sp.]|nr:DUF2244 domain-containing protein [Candidatus Cybelea sp.]
MAHEADQAATLHFEAMLTPHRSLGRLGFGLLMIGISSVSFAAGIGFWWLGAWPICGFMGLDVLLVYIAFKLSYRSARASETVRLSDTELLIRRTDASGAVQSFSFNPYWVRVGTNAAADPAGAVVLGSHGKYVAVGGFLSPDERSVFAAALQDALHRHRSGKFDPAAP